MADDRDPDDLMDLPYFGDHNPPQASAGRVRSTWKFPSNDSEPAPASVEPVQPSRAWVPAPLSVSELVALYRNRQGVDWSLVAELRAQASQRLSDLMSGAFWDKAEQQAHGWAVIRQLLDEDTAEALAKGAEVRSPADQEKFRRSPCSGRSQPSRQ